MNVVAPGAERTVSRPLHPLGQLARDRQAEARALRASLEVKNGSKM